MQWTVVSEANSLGRYKEFLVQVDVDNLWAFLSKNLSDILFCLNVHKQWGHGLYRT